MAEHGAATRRLPVVALALFGLTGLVGPWLAPLPPDAQVDPVSARYRPPMTRLLEIPVTDRGTLLADRIEIRDEGRLAVERRGRLELLDAGDWTRPDGGFDTRTFVLGTDKFGRDLFSRLLWGARVTLWIAGAATALALALGALVGIGAGLAGGWIDGISMRMVDGLLAIPWIFLLVALAAVVPPGPTTLVLVLGGTAWTTIARIARARTLDLRSEPWMLAARALGASPARRILHHLLPNALPPILVEGALIAGALITAEASLSFLGLGVPPPHPSWGAMIAEARHDLATAWWATAFPALAVAGTVLSIHLSGDVLRERLDPRRPGR